MIDRIKERIEQLRDEVEGFVDDAVEYLDAFGLYHDDDGEVTTWAYYAEETHELYSFDADAAAALPLLQRTHGSSYGYSHWCASYGQRMDDDEVANLLRAAASAGDETVVAYCRAHLKMDD